MKTVIFKLGDTYYTTTARNYNAKHRNFNLVNELRDFKTPQEIIDYFCKNFGAKTEDFIIKG